MLTSCTNLENGVDHGEPVIVTALSRYRYTHPAQQERDGLRTAATKERTVA